MRWTLARILFIAAGVGLAWYVWLSWLGALPQYKHEALIEGTLMLYMLIFPSSVLFGFIFAALTIITPIDQINAGNAFLNWMFTTWGPMVIFGYCQWFVLVPRLIRYWRRRLPGELREKVLGELDKIHDIEKGQR